MDNEQLAKQDVAVLNLCAAEGLPGTERLDIAQCCRTLDNWADLVRHETERHLYKFRQNREEYENSEGYFRMLMLITVLQQDLKVRYNPQRIHDPDFKNSRDLFIHGMIGSSNGGTCSSMPVLYAAVARRLGYPVHLILAKAHIFCRWEDSRDRFNIEGSGVGMSTYDDGYYRKWPIPINDKEMERGVYLRNLTPVEELGVFLSARGYCLEDNGRLPEAYLAYSHAYRLSSNNPEYLVALKIAVDKTLMPIARREGTIPVQSQSELPRKPSEVRAQARRSGIPTINTNLIPGLFRRMLRSRSFQAWTLRQVCLSIRKTDLGTHLAHPWANCNHRSNEYDSADWQDASEFQLDSWFDGRKRPSLLRGSSRAFLATRSDRISRRVGESL